MEGRVARTGFMTAGFALSAVLMLAASCDAPPPRAAKAIAPPNPEIAAKTATAPKPKSEPQIVPAGARPSPRPEPVASEPLQHKSQPRTTHRPSTSVAQNSRPYRYGNQPSLRSHGPYDRDGRPMSGPVYEAGRSTDDGCDETCRYRAWFRDYSAWYQTYGRGYGEYPPAPEALDAPAPSVADGPRTAYRPGEVRVRNERDRLDPWHGYNDHDGPQNGY